MCDKAILNMGSVKLLAVLFLFMTFHTKHVNVRGATSRTDICWTAILVSIAAAASENNIIPQSTVILSEDFSVCPDNDPTCKGGQENDRPGFDAITLIHRQIDDDHNGKVDLSESDEFLRDELHYSDDFDRHSGFHRGDKQISVEELWNKWKYSTVYNWTVDETVRWLVECVDLPEYAETFQNNAIEGSTLPKLAVNSPTFLQGILGIKNTIHRQKISLKAMDAVLFGPPKPMSSYIKDWVLALSLISSPSAMWLAMNSYIKDWILVLSLVVALGGCWFAFVQHRYSRNHIMRELESLQQAEDTLKQMQDKLEAAREDHESAVRERQSIEAQLKEEINKAKREAERLRQVRKADVGGEDTLEHYAEKFTLAEEELVQVRAALQETERQLDELMGWSPPSLLQQWLQLTHEVEFRHHLTKKVAAERQLHEAKEVCLKMRRKRGTLIGAFRMAHGSSMDEVDTKLEKARSLLTEVTSELRERTHRWGQIESLCSFHIVSNPGFVVLAGALGLQNIIEQARNNESANVIGSVSHIIEANPPMGIEECDDDFPPIPKPNSNLSRSDGAASVRSMPAPRSVSADQSNSRARQMKTTQSLNNLLGATSGTSSVKQSSRDNPSGKFYLPESTDVIERQDSDQSSTINNSGHSPTTPQSESGVPWNRSSEDKVNGPRARMPSSVSDSNLMSGKVIVKRASERRASPPSLDEEDTGSIGSTGSDVEEKRKRKKFFPLGRKLNKSSPKAS